MTEPDFNDWDLAMISFTLKLLTTLGIIFFMFALLRAF